MLYSAGNILAVVFAMASVTYAWLQGREEHLLRMHSQLQFISKMIFLVFLPKNSVRVFNPGVGAQGLCGDCGRGFL